MVERAGGGHVMKALGALFVVFALALAGDVHASAELGHTSCEHRCKDKCSWLETAQCVANCLSGYGPRCTPVPEVEGFHWPTCHDNYPDCIPPFAERAPASCDCPPCCKYWFDPTAYLHCVTVKCGGPTEE